MFLGCLTLEGINKLLVHLMKAMSLLHMKNEYTGQQNFAYNFFGHTLTSHGL